MDILMMGSNPLLSDTKNNWEKTNPVIPDGWYVQESDTGITKKGDGKRKYTELKAETIYSFTSLFNDVQAVKNAIANGEIGGGGGGEGGSGSYIYKGLTPPPPGSNYDFWVKPAMDVLPVENPDIHYDIYALEFSLGQKIDTLIDLSTNEYHLSQVDETKRPSYKKDTRGLPYIDFVTDEESFLEANFDEWGQDKREQFTMFFAADICKSYANNHFVSFGTKDSESSSNTQCPALIKDYQNKLKLSVNNNTEGSVTVDGTNLLNNLPTLTVLTGVFNRTTGKVLFYKDLEFLGEGTFSSRLYKQTALRIGKALAPDKKVTPTMKFREFIYYHNALSTEQIIDTITHLLAKWG